MTPDPAGAFERGFVAGWEAAMRMTDQQIAIADAVQQAMEAMVTLPASAVRRASQALDDWIATWASDMCREVDVQAARNRIRQSGGTLGYVCDVRMPLDAALKELDHAD